MSILQKCAWLLVLAALTGCSSGGGGGNGAAADATAPQVSGTSMAKDALNVPVNTAVSVTFSEAVDPTSVTAQNFTLTGPDGAVSGTVSVNGATVTFTPGADLDYDTTYTAMLTGPVRDLAGNLMSRTYQWSFTTGSAPDTAAPQVSNTAPAAEDVQVGVNTAVNATFSEAMNAATISDATFTLTGPAGAVAGSVSYNDLTAVFTPASDLDYETVYTATLTTGTHDLAGNTLAIDHSWNFTTGAAPDTLAPGVNLVTPSDNATGVQVNSAISIDFSEAMDPATITSANFTLVKQDVLGDSKVTGTVSYAGITATFTPDADLDDESVYTATVTAVTDAAGNALAADHIWSFTTGLAPDIAPPQMALANPANDATDVAVNGAIAIRFSEPMDPATITTTTLVLKDAGGVIVEGSVIYGDGTATFTPTNLLAYETTYTLTTVSGDAGVKDLAGNALAADVTVRFTTSAAPDLTPPTVTGTAPADAATDVSIGSTLQVMFSEAVDPLTINAATLLLTDAGGNAVSGSVGYSDLTATFSPGASLAFGMGYTLTVVSGSAGVQDLAGNTLATDVVAKFTTGPAPDTTPPTVLSTAPSANATGVDPDATVSATFSENMDGATLDAGSFTLAGPDGAVSGNVSYSGQTATFSPASPLAYAATYTATVRTAAKDVAGNALTEDTVWRFTTLARSCNDIKLGQPGAADGVYAIDPDGVGGLAAFNAYCDMTTHGGGWTVMINAFNNAALDSSAPFDVTWNEITANGVGVPTDLNANFFVAMIRYQAMANASYKVESSWMAQETQSDAWEEIYRLSDHFLDGEQYVLQGTLTGGSGTNLANHIGKPLTTKDVDNDQAPHNNCASTYGAPYWYGNCWSATYWSKDAVSGPYPFNPVKSYYHLKIMIR